MKKYQGFFDRVEGDFAVGWAVGPDRKTPVKVSLEVDGEVVAEGEAALYREGVKKLGQHATGHCGFKLEIPFHIKSRPMAQLRIKVGDSGQEITNSPQIFRPSCSWKGGQNKIFFMHIAKTAGSTVNEVLGSVFPPSRRVQHAESTDWRNPELVQNHDFISGHLRIKEVLRVHDLSQYKIVTVLRDPYRQLVSHLRWLKYIGQQPDQPFFKSHPPVIQDISLRLAAVDFSSLGEIEAYVADLCRPERILFENCQVRYFINAHNTDHVTPEHLLEAQQTAHLFHHIGFTDDLGAFYESLGLEVHPPAKSVKVNVRKQDYGLDAESSEVRSLLAPLIQHDLEFVKYIRENFPIGNELQQQTLPTNRSVENSNS